MFRSLYSIKKEIRENNKAIEELKLRDDLILAEDYIAEFRRKNYRLSKRRRRIELFRRLLTKYGIRKATFPERRLSV